MKTTFKILFFLLPLFGYSQANLGTGFFGKVGINVGSTSPTERLKVNGATNISGILTLGDISDVRATINAKLSTSTAASTYFPKTSGVLYGLTSIRKKTAYNSSDTLFVIGGLGSDFGAVGQGDRLEFKQVSYTGVPRWDISNFIGSTYQTNLTFANANIGVKTTNPTYNFDINGTFRAVGNAIFGGNISANGLTTTSEVLVTNSNAFLTLNSTGATTDNKRWRLQSQTDGTFSISRINDAQTIETNYFKITNNGNIGIRTTTANAPLQFANSLANRKIVLWEVVNNDHQFYGFGLNSGTLRYQVPESANHIFYSAIETTASQQLFSINANQTVTYTPLTTTQINALTGMTAGTMAYNSTIAALCFYDGTQWKRISHSAM